MVRPGMLSPSELLVQLCVDLLAVLRVKVEYGHDGLGLLVRVRVREEVEDGALQEGPVHVLFRVLSTASRRGIYARGRDRNTQTQTRKKTLDEPMYNDTGNDVLVLITTVLLSLLLVYAFPR